MREKRGLGQRQEDVLGGSLRHVEVWMTLELYSSCNLGEF